MPTGGCAKGWEEKQRSDDDAEKSLRGLTDATLSVFSGGGKPCFSPGNKLPPRKWSMGTEIKMKRKEVPITLEREIFRQIRQILLNMARRSENKMPVAVTILVRRRVAFLVTVRGIVLSRMWHVHR